VILTFKYKDQSDNFKVSEDQKIIDVLSIITSNTNMQFSLKENDFIYSKRMKEMVNIRKTFEEAKLYNGDTLILGGEHE